MPVPQRLEIFSDGNSEIELGNSKLIQNSNSSSNIPHRSAGHNKLNSPPLIVR